MEIWLYILLKFVFFIMILLSLLVGSYCPPCIAWITYTNYCYEFFGNQPNFDKICFLIKQYKIKYLFCFYFFGFLNFLTTYFLIWLSIVFKEEFYQIPLFLIPGFLYYFFSYLLIKKILKKMNKIGIFSKEDAIKNFLDFKNKMNLKSKNLIFFTLIKNEKKALRNNPFQFNQKRYKRKIEKLLNKKKSNKQDIILLNIFIRYLKTYSVFFKSMQKENGNYKIKIDNQICNIEKLPEILINNFFAFTKI